MGKHSRIVLCGNSVILASVGASLRQADRFAVVLSASPSAKREELVAMEPDVILFDLENGRPDAAFSLLKASPDLILLGISPDGNLVRLWSGRQLRELSSRDLENVIAEQLAMRSSSP